jgi:hypothetical protein
MVTPMTEQSGRNEPSDRQGSDRPASDAAGSGRSAHDRPRQSPPGADMLSDVQRWLIRSSAKTMRKEITGQVRRTFSGGQRSASSNVWDTATNEIPPDAGESPECQWCPICRAARRMRESGPGIGGQLSGAGDAVASAVQDAVSALDSILGKASGGSRESGGSRASGGSPASGSSQASGSSPAAGQEAAPEHHEAAPHGSAAGDHGPGGWKPGDRLATAQSAEHDAWATATEPDEGAAAEQPEAESATPSAAEQASQPDGQGHEPDDRG